MATREQKEKIAKGDGSIYMYVLANINSRGVYNGARLPDFPDREYDYGESDTQYYNAEEGDEKLAEQMERLDALLREWLDGPTEERREALIKIVERVHVISLARILIQYWREANLAQERLFTLAVYLFYKGRHREVVKFAYVLAATMDLAQVRYRLSKSFYHDLRQVAICDEFTPFFLMGAGNERLSRDVEYLARHAQGWGRAVALTMCEYDTPAKREWLLEHGMQVRHFWPPLAPFVILKSGLSERLQSGEALPPRLFLPALSAAVGYLEYLSRIMLERESAELRERDMQWDADAREADGEAPGDDSDETEVEDALSEEYERDIKLVPLLRGLLNQVRADDNDLMLLLRLGLLKRQLEMWNAKKFYKYALPNEQSELIGMCDGLLYARDLNEFAHSRLFGGKKLNLAVLQLAELLQIDLYDEIYPIWQEHLTDQRLLQHVMLFAAQRRCVPELLSYADEHVKEIMLDDNTTCDLLRMAGNNPGCVTQLVKAALTGTSDYPRGMAMMLLRHWGKKHITPELESAVGEARRLAPNDPFMHVLFDAYDAMMRDEMPAQDVQDASQDGGETELN